MSQQPQQQPKEKEKGILRNLKYMGYCLSQLPPQNEPTTLGDFVDYAKFQLCNLRKVLFKDPIWETYTDEELLREYYACLFHNDEDARKKFEATLSSVSDDDFEWMENCIEENKKELEESGLVEKEFEFDPKVIKDK